MRKIGDLPPVCKTNNKCGFTLDHELRQKKMVVLCSYVSARYTKSMMVAWRIKVTTINKFSFLKLE